MLNFMCNKLTVAQNEFVEPSLWFLKWKKGFSEFNSFLYLKPYFWGWACHTMRLCHPPDLSTSPKYKLLCFIPPYFILPNIECTSFKLECELPFSALFMVASFPLYGCIPWEGGCMQVLSGLVPSSQKEGFLLRTPWMAKLVGKIWHKVSSLNSL
jgi:hypothetical protein